MKRFGGISIKCEEEEVSTIPLSIVLSYQSTLGKKISLKKCRDCCVRTVKIIKALNLPKMSPVYNSATLVLTVFLLFSYGVEAFLARGLKRPGIRYVLSRFLQLTNSPFLILMTG